MSATCPNSRCREPLVFGVDLLGRTLTTCPTCERWRTGACVECGHQRQRWQTRRCDACRRHRLLCVLPARYRAQKGQPLLRRLSPTQDRRRRQGVCIDCGGAVVGRAWRCEEHATAAQARAITEYAARNRELLRQKSRDRVRGYTPEERRAANDKKRQWRQGHRKTVLMNKRKYRLMGRPSGYSTREKYLAYHRAYREAHREERRQLATAQYYREHPERPDPKCRVCGGPVLYNGKFRPRSYCPSHPPAWRRYADRRKQVVA